ncbi:MAG: aliphatic sulfonate ABC transporter permease SsuC [Stenotrophomonas sp.]|uniref:aliphatic sulfonate ABC transporter permease SsuC n=1 Tax=Stenotrophomonas sp. TaxID=69392 RepID=UPI003D6D152A
MSVRARHSGHAMTRARWLPWLVPVGLLLVWQLAASLGWLSMRVLPAPWDVAKAAWALAVSGELWTHLKVSAARALFGLAIGGSAGLLLGLLAGSVKVAEVLLDTSLQMLRNIPALALIPLVILWFGIGEGAKLFLIAVSVFFPIYLNTFHGIRNVDVQLIEMGRSYGLSRWQLYRDVILPGALPSILVGLRFSLGLVWVVLIVAETISAQSGIGYLTMNAREFLRTDIVLVGILLYALLGKLADLCARGLERWWLRWHPGYQSPAAE